MSSRASGRREFRRTAAVNMAAADTRKIRVLSKHWQTSGGVLWQVGMHVSQLPPPVCASPSAFLAEITVSAGCLLSLQDALALAGLGGAILYSAYRIKTALRDREASKLRAGTGGSAGADGAAFAVAPVPAFGGLAAAVGVVGVAGTEPAGAAQVEYRGGGGPDDGLRRGKSDRERLSAAAATAERSTADAAAAEATAAASVASRRGGDFSGGEEHLPLVVVRAAAAAGAGTGIATASSSGGGTSEAAVG